MIPPPPIWLIIPHLYIIHPFHPTFQTPSLQENWYVSISSRNTSGRSEMAVQRIGTRIMLVLRSIFRAVHVEKLEAVQGGHGFLWLDVFFLGDSNWNVERSGAFVFVPFDLWTPVWNWDRLVGVFPSSSCRAYCETSSKSWGTWHCGQNCSWSKCFGDGIRLSWGPSCEYVLQAVSNRPINWTSDKLAYLRALGCFLRYGLDLHYG